VELGWMTAPDDERRRLFGVFEESCRWAAALDCRTIMSPVDKGAGEVARAVDSAGEVGDIAARHDVRLALEFNSQAAQWNSLAAVCEVVRRAAHPACGLLVDTYHLVRSGGRPEDLDGLEGPEIAYVQFSDVPAEGLQPGQAIDRLPPGKGTVPFREIFARLKKVGYAGYMSYEAPNPAAWARDPLDVAREALAATRALLS
jgi:sugar phosphate isomerase/epimerase